MEAPEKSAYVRNMFSSIAPRYDFLNKLLSAGRDKSWRKAAAAELPLEKGGSFLDVATGTGDIAICLIHGAPRADVRVVGVDFSEGMLELGREKVRKNGLEDRIELRLGDATALPFEDGLFQGAIVAFGLRNFSDIEKGLKEMLRVVVPGGRVVILEFMNPENPLFRRLYYFYFRNVLPFLGGIISGNRDAYQYLPDSVLDFPAPAKLKAIMEKCGMQKVRHKLLTFGIVALHVGEKPLRS
ncbi:MAG: bifunctional demethylmenaquinone methyltransferase/2-methoxy-6-polyprenyl-1,4-benzoquinol methylase UbiE [Nitrospinae bacterium]|nr:bifunctional demethylmenaquinone methyltransferase/2-methoxy-6-polyprenyl-1,4-benzoquinol methylase UbiE [Nitrospinota bacterium]